MQKQASEDDLGLSSAALLALQDFALESDLDIDVSQGGNIRLQIQEQLDTKPRNHVFRFVYGGADGDVDVEVPAEGEDEEAIVIELEGVNPELGQTLASTGLTVWRAAKELARFLYLHREWFGHTKTRTLELGSGLGLCGILAAKLCDRRGGVGGDVCLTDGGPEFGTEAQNALEANWRRNSSGNSTRRGEGDHEHRRNEQGDGEGGDGCGECGEPGGGGGSGTVVVEELTWGQHDAFLARFSEGWDFILAADVIYEEEAVQPLFDTVRSLLAQRAPGESRFLLSFARRNVSISTVLDAMSERGLVWASPDTDVFEAASASELIYIVTLAQ